MRNIKNFYIEKALSQIPRILGNMDRNRFSPTYGCCHRDYWLDKTSDFPDAVRQFGIHALSLVYKNNFEGNKYYNNKKILEWIIAGLNFWCKIQHKDGSFDEFYPNERGWVGPTAFTTYTSIESLKIIKNELDDDFYKKVENSVIKAAKFISLGESEEDHLANHHAMACLAVWKAFKLTNKQELFDGYKKLWRGFLSYHNTKEGWSREYDGIDPGYLSATVSFLGKIYQDNNDKEIFEVCKKSIETCSYFVYPNGFYAGSMGSRNTLHFYPHGFEIFSSKIPLANSVAKKMLNSLGENKLVPPEIMSDRYVSYRVPEFILSYLDHNNSDENLPLLPYEKDSLNLFLKDAKIKIFSNKKIFVICNLAKGGVVKIFNKDQKKLIYNDCGFLGEFSNGQQVTTQWIDPKYKINTSDHGFEVEGKFNFVPSNKYFNIYKLILFRIVLLLIGWKPSWAHWLKGVIRKILMIGVRPVNIEFKNALLIEKNKIKIYKKILKQTNKLKFTKIISGGEFFIRYVPQSRYFQSQELDIFEDILRSEDLAIINSNKQYEKNYEIIIDE